MSGELFVSLPSGCRICYETFGSRKHEAVLLIQGHSVAMTQKTAALRQLLSPPKQPYFVVCFDHRDTGRSTSFAKASDDEPVYTLSEMVDDIVGLVHHLHLSRVHLVGLSLGGTLAWQTACRLPNIVRSLALVLTSPVGRQQIPADRLPPLHMEGQWLLGEAFSVPDQLDDDEAWIKTYMQLDLALATQSPTEAELRESRQESEMTYRRERESGTLWTKFNHSDASGVRWPRELLQQIQCPTVVVHAAKDQLFPLKHAEALKNDVKGATLVILDECGHELPHRVRQQVVDAIIANAKRARDDSI